jgi:NitT/TauT family transport system substrate-binding protein
MLKGADVVAKDTLGTARFLVDRGYTTNYDYTCDILKRIRHNVWRDFDPVDSIRFDSLRLKEAGYLKGTPEEVLEQGTDFRYFNQLRTELRTA